MRGNQKTGTQEVLDLTWNADHQLIESNTTRHGVTQATRYAYDPLGRRVAKSDAFGSTHYLWDRDLMVHSRRAQDRRCTSMSREALCRWPPFRERAKSTAPTGTSATRSVRHWITDEQGQGVWATPRPTLGLLVVASHCGTEYLKNQSRLPNLLCRHKIPFAKGKCIIEVHTVGYIAQLWQSITQI